MRMYISLYPNESKALGELAQRERRHPREQAALLIRRGLELAGVLESNADCQPGRRPPAPGGGTMTADILPLDEGYYFEVRFKEPGHKITTLYIEVSYNDPG